MPTPHENRQYILRLWIPALLFIGFFAVIVIAALTSRDPGRVIPAVVAIGFAAFFYFGSRWNHERRTRRLLRSADPREYVRYVLSTAARSRIPHVGLIAAANAATFYALHGRFMEAERALESVSWHGAPPIIEAQERAARAVLAYTRGELTDGLDHAVAAGQLATVDDSIPGAQTSALAFRTYRNLGLALAGRATTTTAGELRTAATKLPRLGQILAAWGLAAIAKHQGDELELDRLRLLIAKQAPHFGPVLETLA